MKKVNICVLILDIILGTALLIAVIYMNNLTDEVSLQKSAESWRGSSDTPFTTVSLHTDENNAMTIGQIYSMRSQILKSVEEQITDLSDKYYADCYSMETEKNYTGDKDSSSLTTMVTGGDFFLVHTPKVISGSVYTDETANINTAVLDDYASWKLFGSVDTAGMTIYADNKEYTVSAVIKSPQSKNLKKAYDNNGLSGVVYIPYQSVENSEQGTMFTSYEIILPDTIENFAENIVRTAASLEKDSSQKVITDSRSEFLIKNISKNAKNNDKLISSDISVKYPFWAEADRFAHITVNNLYNIFFVPFVIIMMTACFWVIMLCRLLVFTAKKIYRYFDKKSDMKKLEKYRETHPLIVIKPKDDEGESQ